MADNVATFGFELKDQSGGAAADLESQISGLRDSILGGNSELKAMQAALRNLKGGALGNSQAFKDLKDKILAKKTAVAQAQAAYISLGGSFEKVKPPTQEMKGFTDVANGMPGPIGRLSGQLSSLKSTIGAGSVLAIGALAFAAALIAVSAAAVVAAGALVKYGISVINARRNEELMLQGLSKARNWYGIAGSSASFLQGEIDKVSASTALGRDKVADYARELERAGLRGANFQHALKGIVTTASTQGDGQAQLFKSMALGAHFAGTSVKALADDVESRLGGIAAAQMLDLNVQFEKAKENIGMMFKDLKIDGFLKSLKSITDLFSQNEAVGRALKQILETLFSPLNSGAESSAIIMKRFFQGLVIGTQQVIIAYLRVRVWFKRTFGDSSLLKDIDKQGLAVKIATAIAWGFAIALGVAALAALALVAALALLAAPFVALTVGAAMAVDYLTELDWGEIGTSLVDGLIGGVARGAKKFISAVKGLATDAMKAFSGEAEIRSPSRAMARLSYQLPAGGVQGVEQGAPEFKQSIKDMFELPKLDIKRGGSDVGNALTAPRPEPAAWDRSAFSAPRQTLEARPRREPQAPPATRGRAGNTFTFGPITIAAPSSNPKDMVDEFMAELERRLEGAAFQAGAKT